MQLTAYQRNERRGGTASDLLVNGYAIKRILRLPKYKMNKVDDQYSLQEHTRVVPLIETSLKDLSL